VSIGSLPFVVPIVDEDGVWLSGAAAAADVPSPICYGNLNVTYSEESKSSIFSRSLTFFSIIFS